MKVEELLAILKECDPTADVMFCYDEVDGEYASMEEVNFVHFCHEPDSTVKERDSFVFLYGGEPPDISTIESVEPNREIEVIRFARHGDAFAETVYSEV